MKKHFTELFMIDQIHVRSNFSLRSSPNLRHINELQKVKKTAMRAKASMQISLNYISINTITRLAPRNLPRYAGIVK